MWMCNNPYSDGKEPMFWVPGEDRPLAATGNEPWEWDLGYQVATRYARKKLGDGFRLTDMDRMYRDMAVDFVRHNPVKFISDTFKRFCWVFNAYEFPNNKDPYEFFRFSPLLRWLSYVHWGVVCPFALLGLVLTVRHIRSLPTGMAYYLLLLGSLVATLVMFIINDRYRLPIVAVLIPLAGAGLVSFAQRLRLARTHVRPLVFTVAGLAALAFFCNLNLFGYKPPRRPAYLLWINASACDACLETDLLDEVMSRLGPEMDPPQQPGSITALIIQYYRPYRTLMLHHLSKREMPKALHYGELMIQREPYDESMVKEYVLMGVNSGRREDARKALQAIALVLQDRNPYLLGESSLFAGERYHDPEALAIAVRTFQKLSEAQPGQGRFRERLDAARLALASVVTTTRETDTRPTTRPRSNRGQP
jgi:hypothetical protein